MGFMGSGKSTVGPLAATSLGWDFRDLDAEVERRVGTPVPELIVTSGEEAFRRREDEAARALLALERVVVAAGGGWPCRPGRMEALPAGTLAVWLTVSPEVALERVRASGIRRPLLDGPDPEARARELLGARRPYYALAQLRLDTGDRTPDELARAIADAVHSTSGSA